MSARTTRAGQAAMEFIMTYGWAILVVMVMIGALTYFGVVNAKDTLPEKCLLTSGFTCKDFIASDRAGVLNLTLFIEQETGTAITINAINMTYLDKQLSVLCTSPSAGALGQAVRREYNCIYPAGSGPGAKAMAKFTAAITYTKAGGIYPQTADAELLARVQQG